MIKKILPISVFVLVFVIILLLGLQNMLSNRGGQTGVAVTPTMIPGKQGSYTPQRGVTGTTTSPGQTERINTTTTQVLSPQEFQQKLPINSPEFTIDFSSRMQKYVVTLKTENGQAAYEQWLLQNTSLAPHLAPEQVVIAHQTVAELNAALDEAKKNILTPEEEFKKSTDTILTILNTLYAPISLPETTPSPTPLPVVFPTLTPIPVVQPTSVQQTTSAIPFATLTPLPLVTPASIQSMAGSLLPNPINPIASKALNFQASVQSCLRHRGVYDTASSQTGVPWEILAAIHYNEGACGDTKSLVSGREIGTNEPDIVRGGGCSSSVTGPGVPVALSSGGCGFYTLLDSAIYAGNHIKGKIGKVPTNFEELAKAFSRYSGGGNSNCNKTPYPYCPRLFEGEDDAYVMNMFDQKHETMYLVYCADLTKCNPARIHGRPGVTTIIRLLTNQL